MPKIDWESLGFDVVPTNCHVQYHYKDGKWDDGELKREPFVQLSIAATCLHYGQSLFEGLKVFRRKDGKVSVFRDDQNCERMANSANYLCCAVPPLAMFQEAVTRVVKENLEFVPPYGTGGSLYVRPLLFGTSVGMGVKPSKDYTFLVMCTPVGPYYKSGFTAVDAVVIEQYDRVAPKGSGRFKVSGNYAASFTPNHIAHEQGYPVTLFLDALTHTYIDEFGTSNFIGIHKNGSYVTPESESILPSITNKSLVQLALDMGLKVERRPVRFDELPDFKEIGACGTAVVITPVGKVVRGDTCYRFAEHKTLHELYKRVQGIQYGELPDVHGWNRFID